MLLPPSGAISGGSIHMYGTSEDGGEEASTPPNCPACQGKTYYVDPEQTVITCYDCGRYFRRKKPGADEAQSPPVVPAPPVQPPVPEAPPPPPQAPEPIIPEPPVPEPIAAEPSVPEAPEYAPPPPPTVPEPPVPEPAAPEEGDFDLVISSSAEEPAPPVELEMSGEPVACSVCGFPMDEGWKVCPNCVSRYESDCGSCGKRLQAWWLICPWCETPKSPDHIHTGR